MTQSPSSAGTRQSFDWAAIHARLDEAGRRLQAADAPSGADVRRILRQRAAVLRTPPAVAPDRLVDLVAFGLGAERYGIAVEPVLQAVRVTAATWLPGLPACYRGVCYQRGDVFPILDLRPLLGLAEPGPETPPFALLVQAEGRAVALAADRLEGLVRVAAAAIRPAEGAEDGPAVIEGMTPDQMIVLDIRRLIQDARLGISGRGSARNRNGGTAG